MTLGTDECSKPSARIAVLISGGGRTLKNLVDAIRKGELHAEIAVVVGSRACPGLTWASDTGIPTRIMSGDLSADAVLSIAREFGIDWMVLAGYLKRVAIPPELEGRIVNIHPALLPRFGGRGMYGRRVHESVLAAGETESGCTVHLCDSEYDHGPILAQLRCPVMMGDTVDSLAERVFGLECQLYPRALESLFGESEQNRSQPRAKSVSE